jgi:hypothetical protein
VVQAQGITHELSEELQDRLLFKYHLTVISPSMDGTTKFTPNSDTSASMYLHCEFIPNDASLAGKLYMQNLNFLQNIEQRSESKPIPKNLPYVRRVYR